jgi:hypothetical protein
MDRRLTADQNPHQPVGMPETDAGSPGVVLTDCGGYIQIRRDSGLNP